MIRAYSESYLSNAKSCLAACFDYAVNDCGLSPDWCAQLFLSSGIADQFEQGNPMYLAGMSGVEMTRQMLLRVYPEKALPEPVPTGDCSREYWAGWALAEYQWYTARRFRDIFQRIPLSRVLELYSPYHEMDILHFIDTMEELYKAAQTEPKLRRIRESRGLSQSELSRISGVHIRNIQAYEQRDNDIDKAQGRILYQLSRALGCSIEDLLENPME